MNRYAIKLKDYLEKFGEEKYERLNQAGELVAYCKLKGQAAQERKDALMRGGMLDYEAEEVVISELFQD